jgi:hypothetical protein
MTDEDKIFYLNQEIKTVEATIQIEKKYAADLEAQLISTNKRIEAYKKSTEQHEVKIVAFKQQIENLKKYGFSKEETLIMKDDNAVEKEARDTSASPK